MRGAYNKFYDYANKIRSSAYCGGSGSGLKIGDKRAISPEQRSLDGGPTDNRTETE
jgi:hypothetical protein